jgi:hypothetical protein
MKVTAVSLSSESGDHYTDVWDGHLSEDEIRIKINEEYGDEAEFIYVDDVVHHG